MLYELPAEAMKEANQEANQEPVPEPTPEEFEDFKHQVDSWLNLDKNIKLLSIAIRERRRAQAALAPKIQEFMAKYRYTDLNTSGGIIRDQVRNVKQPLRIKDVKKKIEETHGDAAVEQIFFATERPVMVKHTLKRIEPKVSMRLDI